MQEYLKEERFLYGRRTWVDGARRHFAFPNDPFACSATCWHGQGNFRSLYDRVLRPPLTDHDMLFWIWGHTYEFDFPSCKGFMDTCERIFADVSERDGIIKCTFAEAFRSHFRESGK